jgi:putative salt-induced outer membrane protein YdiY
MLSDGAAPAYTLVNGQLPKAFYPGQRYAFARFTAAAKTNQPLKLSGVKAAWLDGKPLDLKAGVSAAAIAAGDHVLAVEVDGAAPYLKAQCDDVSFLGD